MKPVVGLLLVFVGLAVGYMVITGKLPSGQPQGNPGNAVNPSTRGSNIGIGTNVSANLPTNIGVGTNVSGTGGGPSSHFTAYRGMV